MKRILLALLVIVPMLLHAEDIKRADGTILKATVVRAEPDGLVVQTNSGIEKIDFLLLSTEVQKRFNYDPEKYREYRASQATARQQLLEQQIASVRAQAAALDEIQKQQPTPEEAAKRVLVERSLIFVTARVLAGMSQGAYAQLTVLNGHAAPTMLDKDTRVQTSLGNAYIYGLEGAEGDTWQGKIYPAGYYHGTTPDGGEYTLRAYATSVEGALTHGADGRGPTTPSVDPTAAQRFLPGSLRGNTLLDK